MPSRRYYIAIAPVAHINGKMAPGRKKCPNTDDPEQIETSGFWYGYKRQARPDVSRYGIRTRGRDLNTHPYTIAEDENRTLFTSSLFAVYDHQGIEGDWKLMMTDFRAQSHYRTPIGYAVAVCRQNAGEWPGRWIETP